MGQYGVFAYIYDELMEDVDYKKWTNHIEDIMKFNKKYPKNILELACGTGNITIILKEKGYNVVGLDISEEMLEVAYLKSLEAGKKIHYIAQDIVKLDYQKQTDCILCMCDGFNYITNLEDLKKSFENIYKTLDKDGILIFDISSYYKIKNILGNNYMADKREDLTCLWINTYDDESKLIEMDLTFFVKDEEEFEVHESSSPHKEKNQVDGAIDIKDEFLEETVDEFYEENLDEMLDLLKDLDDDYDDEVDGEKEFLYRKFEEKHYQRAHTEEEIIKLLKEVGFKNIHSFGDFDIEKPKENSERIFFSAIK